jgi:hypothetical protein
MHPEYPEYRPPSQRDLNRASLRRILFWFGLAAVLFALAAIMALLD